MEYISLLVGVLIAVSLFVTFVVVWQVMATFVEVRATLKAFRELSRQLQTDLSPTLKDLNGLLEKTNSTLDSVERLNHSLHDAQDSLNTFVKGTQEAAGKLLHVSKDYLTIVGTGFGKGWAVWKQGNGIKKQRN